MERGPFAKQNNIMTDEKDSEIYTDVSHFLSKQYDHIENYCQAQIQLQNLLTKRDSSKLEEEMGGASKVRSSLTLLQNDYAWLQNMISSYDAVMGITINEKTITKLTLSLLQKHLQVTKRVLLSVYDSYHVNGIIRRSSMARLSVLEVQEQKKIALATLRASSTRVTASM